MYMDNVHRLSAPSGNRVRSCEKDGGETKSA